MILKKLQIPLLDKQEKKDFLEQLRTGNKSVLAFDVSDTMNLWFDFVLYKLTYDEKKKFVKNGPGQFLEAMHKFPDFDYGEVDEYLRFYNIASEIFTDIMNKNGDLLELIPF